MSVDFKQHCSQTGKFIAKSAFLTADHFRNLIRLVVAAVHRRRSRHRLRDHENEAGKSLAEHRIGDEKLLAQLDQIEDRIASLSSAGSSTKSVEAERRGLFRRLYFAHQEQNANRPEEPYDRPQLDRVRQQAAEAATEVDRLRTAVLPRNTDAWGGLATGYGVIGLGLVAFALLFSGSAPPPSNATETFSGSKPVSSSATDISLAGTDAESTFDRAVVSSITDDKIDGAVGFTVSGGHLIFGNGDENDFASSTGSCFAISSDGHFLTNRHVVESYQKLTRAELLRNRLREKHLTELQPRLWVFIGGSKYKAATVHVDTEFDLAVLKIEETGHPYFRLSPGGEVDRATPVFAIGYPGVAQMPISESEVYEAVRRKRSQGPIEKRFKERDFEFVLTNGTVSRTVTESEGHEWLQHNATIHPGNSGGPLVTKSGVVVGINTMRHAEASGISLALTLDQLRDIILEHVPNARFDDSPHE